MTSQAPKTRVNPGPVPKPSLNVGEETSPTQEDQGDQGQGDSNSSPNKGRRSYRVVNNPFNFTGISVCDEASPVNDKESEQDKKKKSSKKDKEREYQKVVPKAYAPKHAERYSQDVVKKKRKYKRSRSASHSPHANRRSTANASDNDKGEEVSTKPAKEEETEPVARPAPVKPNPVPPQQQVNKPRAPVMPPPVNMIGQKPPPPQIWNSNVIPLNAKPGPWNKSPFNPHPNAKPHTSFQQGDGPGNPGHLSKEELLEKYKNQTCNYSNESKQYKPAKNSINEFFYQKLKHMKPGELDDWYKQQYLAWNQAQVKAKVNSCLIAVPKQVVPQPGNQGDGKQVNAGPKPEDSKKPSETTCVEQPKVQVHKLDSYPNPALFPPHPKARPQNNVLAPAYDNTVSPVRKLIEEVSPLVKSLLQKKDLAKDKSLVQETKKEEPVPAPEKETKLAGEAKGVAVSMSKPIKEMSFYQYIKGVMMPVMIKGVPETVFNGRDKNTGSYVRDYAQDHNPCRKHLDVLQACYKNNTVTDKEMVKIRNSLAECIMGNQEFFYAKREKKTLLSRVSKNP